MAVLTPDDEAMLQGLERSDGSFIGRIVDTLWGKPVEATLPRPDRRFGVQWRPNLIRPERRLVLSRIYWNWGTPGDGRGWSGKVSVSVGFQLGDLWIGLAVSPKRDDVVAYLCFIPCLPIRIHFVRSWGGRFI